MEKIKNNMEKKIQDYLHLYLKSPIQYRFLSGKNWSKWFDIEPECVNMLNDMDIHAIELSLRPLSSMTEDELEKVYYIERFNTEETPAGYLDFDLTRIKETECWKIIALDMMDTILFIGDHGSMHKVTEDNGKQMIEIVRNIPRIIKYLLSRGFDLFDLIPSGLAIDKTKTP